MPLSSISSHFLVFIYYSVLFPHCGVDDIRRVIILVIFEFAMTVAVYFLLYATKEAVPDYNVGYPRFDYVGGAMLFWLPFSLVNVLSHFGFCKISEKMCMDPVLAALASRRVTEVDWVSSVVQMSLLRTISPREWCLVSQLRECSCKTSEG